MPISLKDFTGEFPRTLPHLLPENAAQQSVNCDFTQNALNGTRVWKEVNHGIPQGTLSASNPTLYAHNNTMLVFPYDSDVCRSPVANDMYDRVYWTQKYPGYEYLYLRRSASLGWLGGFIGATGASIQRAGVPAPVTTPQVQTSSEFMFSMLGTIPVQDEVIIEDADGNVVSSTVVNWVTARGVVTTDTLHAREWEYTSLNMGAGSSGTTSGSKAATGLSLPKLPANLVVAGDAVMSVDNADSGNGKNFSLPAYVDNSSSPNPTLYVHWGDWLVAPLPSVIYSVDVGFDSLIYTPMYHIGYGWYCTTNGAAPPNDGMFALLQNLVTNSGSGSSTSSTTPALRVTFGYRTIAGVITERKYVAVLRTDYAKSSFPVEGFTGGISIIGNKVVAHVSRAATAIAEERVYVYTFVNEFDEEGPPSPPLSVSLIEGDAVRLLLPGASGTPDTAGFATIDTMRLYRSATGSNATEFLFVAQINTGATNTYTDTKKTTELVETLATTGYYPPPRYLTGLVSLPNGIFAAFKGNEIWFSEPYLPYAWNPDNVLTTLHDVVSICPAEGGMYVTTKSHPYFVSGVTPDAMSQIKLTSIHAGVAKDAICNMGPAVVWATNDGLVTARGVDAGLDWSYKFFTRDEWRDRYGSKLDKMRLDAHDGHLLMTFSDGTPAVLFRFDEAAPSMTNLSYGFFATSTWVNGDSLVGITYTNGQFKIVQFKYSGPGAEARDNFVWHSKDFIAPKPVNFGVMQLVGNGLVTVEVFADGVSRHTRTVSLTDTGSTVFRLPAGFKARRWSFLLSGNGIVTEATMAVSPMELQGV